MNLSAAARHSLAIGMLAWLAAPAYAQLAADAHELPPHIELDQVLPETLMQSGNHRIEDNLRIKGTLFEFTVDSDQGRYEVRSIPMTILRIHEIQTLAQAIDAFQRDNLRLAEELRGITYVGRNSAVRPISSLGSGPGDQAYAHDNVGQAVKELRAKPAATKKPAGGPRSDTENIYESFLPSDPILASYKRSVASHLNLDVYSSNPRVQAFLDTLARARAGGNRNAGMVTVAIPNLPEISVDRGRIEFAVRTAVARNTIRELYIKNEAVFSRMGVAPDIYHAFLSHRAFSPRHKSEITAYLAYMDGVANRSEFLRAATRATDEVSALGYARMARMLAFYHETTEKLAGLVSGGHVLMATTVGNNMVMVLPYDLVWWDANADRVFSSLTKFADDSGFELRELLLVGIASDAARGQLERRKFNVREKFLLRR